MTTDTQLPVEVEERGVQNNVAMVGDESIAFSGVVIIQTVDGEAIGPPQHGCAASSHAATRRDSGGA